MKLDLTTLIIVQCIVLTIHAIVLFLQYRTRPSYPGTGWWAAGVALMALAVSLMPFVRSPSWQLIAVLANPLLVLGQGFLYIGMLRYWSKKNVTGKLAALYAAFLPFYFYYLFIDNNLSARTFLVNVILALASFLTATVLFNRKKENMTLIEGLTAFTFLLYALFVFMRGVLALLLPPLQGYENQYSSFELATIVFLLASTLWSFEFIILVNRRLNRENQLEKDKMQNVFNTGPDAVIIARMSDGLIVDVNEQFTATTGYSREESIGKTTLDIGLWSDVADRNRFLAEMARGGFCENMEATFSRRDGSHFDGALSARSLLIHGTLHAVGLIRDMTRAKQAETQIHQLIQELEAQRNAAEHNSLTDSLTGLSNRRYFDEALKTEFSRMNRSGSELSLIMLDVDFFKSYNDLYGHVAGDECLRRMAATFRKLIVRAPDIVARYGGEEFVIILPNTDNHGAYALAERLREEVASLRIPHELSAISDVVTISLGVATAAPMKWETPDKLVNQVDEAMYLAKKNGRNRVEKAV